MIINYIQQYGNNSNRLLFLILCIVNNCNHIKSTRDRYSHYACNISIDSCTRLAKTINITNQIYNIIVILLRIFVTNHNFGVLLRARGFYDVLFLSNSIVHKCFTFV